jgi:hypothetical protein
MTDRQKTVCNYFKHKKSRTGKSSAAFCFSIYLAYFRREKPTMLAYAIVLPIQLNTCFNDVQIGVIKCSAPRIRNSSRVNIQSMDIVGHQTDMRVGVPIDAKLGS